MPNILLGVTGSVAAIKTPALYSALRKAGHRVKVVATQASLYFFEPALLDPADASRPVRNPEVVILDDDEWPGRGAGRQYARGDPVLHIELRRWADLLLMAPLDANTLAKLAGGLADNCLTCVWRAWDPARPVVLAPAMNTLMWEHPLTRRHLRLLLSEGEQASVPADGDQDGVVAWINEHAARLRVVPPRSKELACGDIGVGAMADLDELVRTVGTFLAPTTP
jgi:phosphopantothenoylcysteine decarboxylase